MPDRWDSARYRRSSAGGCCKSGIDTYAIDKTPTYTFGDLASWTLGNAPRDLVMSCVRTTARVRSAPSHSSPALEQVQTIGGSAPGAPQAVAGGVGINNTNPAFSTLGTTTAGTARNLLDYMAGSVNSINETYWLTNPTDTTFTNYATSDRIVTPLHQTEMSTFAKDDYKITKHLTLNLGVR